MLNNQRAYVLIGFLAVFRYLKPEIMAAFRYLKPGARYIDIYICIYIYIYI